MPVSPRAERLLEQLEHALREPGPQLVEAR
jgi:hypothetical protein